MRTLLVTAGLAALSFGSASALGQGWVNCDNISRAAGLKLVITDLIGQQEHLSALLHFQERLNVRVRPHEEKSRGPLAVVLCEKSRPQVHEFEHGRITSLDQQRVLTVLAGRLGNDAMSLHTVSVPYRREAIEKSMSGSRGLDSQNIPVSGTKTGELSTLLVQDRITELAHAYFVLGLGLRFLNNRDYGLAQTFLCTAKRSFADLSKGIGPPPPQDVLTLLEDKLKVVAASMSARGAGEFTRDNPAERCGA